MAFFERPVVCLQLQIIFFSGLAGLPVNSSMLPILLCFAAILRINRTEEE
jgi:hypothetical protein